MSSFALKVKSKSGHHVISSLQPGSTIKELKSVLASLTDITVQSLHILSGFPPKVFDVVDENQTLTASGLTSGETLIIEEKQENKIKKDPKMTASSSELLQAINEQQNCQGLLIRHVVPADNSCLFNSLYYSLNRKIDSSGEALKWIRELVAETISKDSETYSEAILGKPVDEYCSWIKQPTSWGGAIELSVLSNHYGIEIAVVDTMNGIVNRFGEDHRFPVRVYLMFDGIHYDPLYMENFQDGSIKTMFQSEDEGTLKQAEQLAKEAKSSRQFTNVQNFKLECMICKILLKGQVEAQQHAEATGHANFGEV